MATPCGFESHHRHHVGAKSALLRRSFVPMEKRTSSARSLAPPFRPRFASLDSRSVFDRGRNEISGMKPPGNPGSIDFSMFPGLSLVYYIHGNPKVHGIAGDTSLLLDLFGLIHSPTGPVRSVLIVHTGHPCKFRQLRNCLRS